MALGELVLDTMMLYIPRMAHSIRDSLRNPDLVGCGPGTHPILNVPALCAVSSMDLDGNISTVSICR